METIRGELTGRGLNSRAAATDIPRLSFTPDEAALSTGFSRTRIFQAIRGGELTARKDGKATVIEKDELLRWLRSLPTRGRKSEVAA
jgi:excisionase family DNA binding protein